MSNLTEWLAGHYVLDILDIRHMKEIIVEASMDTQLHLE